jgi:glycerophosphoryl diester phosphodiesterase
LIAADLFVYGSVVIIEPRAISLATHSSSSKVRTAFLILTLLAAVDTTVARSLVIAHRGASGYLPEHTLAAKALAHGLGADFIEQDIVLSKDDVAVVLHDIHLDTVSDVARRFPERKREDGRYYAIDFTLAELKELRLTERFDRTTGLRVFPRRFPAEMSGFTISTLEEELQLIQGLNRSTGRNVGIYPEIKQPQWHRREGHDISRIVLAVLERHGYATKEDACWLQCFELAEVRRLRHELGWRGRLLMLIEGNDRGNDGTDYARLCTPEGLDELTQTVDGIGPAIDRIVRWDEASVATISDLSKQAHARGLVVHPFTVRIDALPPHCPSEDDLHQKLYIEAGIDGVFTDFTDVTRKWVDRNKR